jgi:N-hydroxyarylamine O-acetyltransferase
MDIKKYLQRIGAQSVAPGEGSPACTAETLRFLQRRHLLSVPFENLDIHWKRPIVLDPGAFYRKVVEENRGGFCYELNGLFNVLLNELGYETKMVSARVGINNGEFSPEYDHMAILAKADGDEYLVDVGFGDFTAEPLKFAIDAQQEDGTGVFRIRKYDDRYFIVEKKNESGWKSEDIFTTTARNLAEYSAMCNFHQTSPESHFMKNKICSLMTESGRKTLTGDKFIETKNGERTEMPIGSPEQFDETLRREFNIEAIH